MNTIFIGPGGIPRVVSSQSPGSSSQSQRVANSLAAGVSQAVQSVQSKQSSPAISDRVEDITGQDDDAKVARQAAAFAAQFMLPASGGTSAPESAAVSSSAAPQARLMRSTWGEPRGPRGEVGAAAS